MCRKCFWKLDPQMIYQIEHQKHRPQNKTIINKLNYIQIINDCALTCSEFEKTINSKRENMWKSYIWWYMTTKNISRILRGTDHQFHHRDHSPINHPTHCKYKTETLRVTQKFELNAKIKKYLQCTEQQCSQ